VTTGNDFYIFDGHSKEIVFIDGLDLSVRFTFGRFQLGQVDRMFLNGDYLSVYDARNDKTTIFLSNGKYENEFSGLTFYDSHRNLLTIKNNTLYEYGSDRILFSAKENNNSFGFFLNFENNLMSFRANEFVKVKRILYENR
jgi:hypothetical protein